MDRSPLARLPPEIRVTIYTLILGGQDVHVRNIGNIISHSICTNPVSHQQTLTAIKNRTVEDVSFPEEFDHYYCATYSLSLRPTPIRLDLRIFCVCREIYREAALLPFKTNTFVFSHASQIQLFSNTLEAFQRKAVASICLVTSEVDPYPRNFSTTSGLHGLQVLIIVLGVAARTTSEDVNRFLDEAVECFGRHSLAFVEILIRFRKTKLSADELRLLGEQYATRARDTEQTLLAPSKDDKDDR